MVYVRNNGISLDKMKSAFRMKYSLRFFCTERIIFAKASALCCEDGDSFMAALKVSLKCGLAKKTEVSISSQVRAKYAISRSACYCIDKTVMLERVARSADAILLRNR